MKTISLLLFPKFQMLAYVLATETLRLANKCAGAPVFRWQTRSSTNEPVLASNGASVIPDTTDWSGAQRPDLVLLCAGYDPLDHVTARSRAYLARMNAAKVTLGGVDTGTVILAQLGLLDGYRAVLHHEAEAAFREVWPDIAVSDSIYCIDGPRLTAAGGTATGDAILAWIAQVTGPDLARAVSDGMAHGGIRASDAPQRQSHTKDPVLIRMERLMREDFATPLPIAELAGRLGLSMKQLRRLCHLAYGQTPTDRYLGLRLGRAYDLLATTHLSVTSVASATGFASLATFSRAFKAAYGLAPTQARVLRQ